MTRVTIVNDNPDFLALMEEIVGEMSGFEPTILDGDVCSVADVVASRPDILFIDLRLGDGTLKGWDFAVLSRAHEELRTIPLIVCSADVRTLHERQAEFLEYGNIHTLEKPFNLADVERLLATARAAS